MKWSWKITQIAGIDVYIHSTFFLLVAWFGYTYWDTYGTVRAALEGITFIIALFLCVILHEFGHALMAKRFNVVTRSITLLPIGGVAAMQKMPEKPQEEMLVAIAGPAVNIVIAALLYTWIYLNEIPFSDPELFVTEISLIHRLLIVNIFLVIFNMLPAFPMDGGRVLRAALALRFPHYQATDIAAKIGRLFAVIFFILSFYGNPMLMLIAVFLWFGAGAENAVEQVKVTLGDATAEDAMLTEFHMLDPEDALSKAMQFTLQSDQRDFPVGNAQGLGGVLTQAMMLETIKTRGEQVKMSDIKLLPLKAVNHNAPVQQVLEFMEEIQCSMMAVIKHGRVIGIISQHNILEYIKIQQARGSREF